MIVISGALVLVALGLLVIGIVGTELTFVYASIAVSLVSLGFLIIGILQRRGEVLPGHIAVEGAPAAVDAPVPGPVRVVEPVPVPVPGSIDREPEPEPAPEPAPVPGSIDREPEHAGSVLVVPGRPRYHVQGCRYLTGKDAEQVDVLDARDEGFTPCGVCRPDDALGAALAPEPVVEEPVVEEPTAPLKALKELKAPRAAPAKAPAKTATAARSTPAAVTGRNNGSVVVIPDRGRFHRSQCRYVRGADGLEVLTKAAALRQGYDACGVCKP